MQSGIYKISNAVNSKLYIGSAINLRERIKNHRTRLNCGIHKNRHLQSAFNKHGADAFKIETLLICKPDDLLFYEQRCIDGFDAVKSGYNIMPIAGSSRGRIMNPVSVAKMAATKRGKKQSPEHLAARIAGMNRPESKARMAAGVSAALTGKQKAPEHVAKVAAALRGRAVSQETRAKIAANLTGRKFPPRKDTSKMVAAQRLRRHIESNALIQLA